MPALEGFVIDKKEWDEVIALCKELPAKVGQNAFSKSVNSGIDIILNLMKNNIKVDAKDPTGLLEKSLYKRRKRKYEPTFWHGSVAVNVGKKRGDGAFYWNIVEHGHRIVSPAKVDTGRRVKAMRYAIEAFEVSKGGITSDFARKTRTELERQFNKRAK